MIILKVRQLTKSFSENTVFSDISFGYNNNTLGIAGSNGSGKSTFLKCLAGLLAPSNGTVTWQQDDEEISKQTFNQKLGYAAPYINLYNELSCRENLHFLAKVRHENGTANHIDHWIKRVELSHVADHPYGKLSTGQKQRLRLASALFHNPDILMLDEPGSNLDEAGRSLITNIVDTFRSPEKLLIIASNTPNELRLCEQIFSIEEAKFTYADRSENS